MRYGLIYVTLAMLLLAGCGTQNVGSGVTGRGPQFTAVFTADNPDGENGGWYPGLTATLTVSWPANMSRFYLEERDSFTILADMGGGTVEGAQESVIIDGPFVRQFTLANPGPFTSPVTFTYTVTLIISSTGNSGIAAGSYSVAPFPNNPPSIDDIRYQGSMLTVSASDPNGDELTVTVTEPQGLYADASAKPADPATGEVVFYWSAYDPFSSITGITTITVDDGHGGTVSDTCEIGIYFYSLYGAIVAAATATEASIDDRVMVVVICGSFMQPFKYANSVVVTVDQGASYVTDSFNVGAPGGERFEPDGLWAYMNPPPADFLAAYYSGFTQDWMPGKTELSFTAIPLGGNNTTDGGALFNFELEFSQPGTYTLGILDVPEVKRTYFSDMDGNEFGWDDTSNDFPDLPNSIVVTDPL